MPRHRGPDVALPVMQFIFNAAPMTAATSLWPFRRAYHLFVACPFAMLRMVALPRYAFASRGRIKGHSS